MTFRRLDIVIGGSEPLRRPRNRWFRWGLARIRPSGFWFLSLFLLLSLTSETRGADCVLPPPGLIAWWRGADNAFDSIGTNDARTVGGVGYGTGLIGRAFNFTGEGDDFLRLPPNVFPVPSAGQGNLPFSFEFWFKTTSGGVVLGQQDAPTFTDLTGYVPAIYVGTNGFLYGSLFWGFGPLLVSPTSVADGQFHHAAVVYDGGTKTLFIDGAAVQSIPFTQEGYADTYYYQLGTGFTGGWPATPGGWFPFTGIVDEACLYQRALTPQEVAGIYGAGAAGKCGGLSLRHRYSFNGAPGSTAVVDSMRRANGALFFAATNAPYDNGPADGSAFTGTGELRLAGTSGYVALPSGILSEMSAVSLETWARWDGPVTNAWQRIFDFGAHNRELGLFRQGTNYLMLCPSRGDRYVLGFQETIQNPLSGLPDPNAVVVYTSAPLPVNQWSHVVLTYDPPAGQVQLFLNGSQVGAISGRTLNPLSSFNDVNNWLGRSQWGPDPGFKGSFDEFRLWDGALTAQDVGVHYLSGPDQVFDYSQPTPYLSIQRSGSGLLISWSAVGTAGYKLQSSPAPNGGLWSNVESAITQVNGAFQTSLPLGSGTVFYRLFRQP